MDLNEPSLNQLVEKPHEQRSFFLDVKLLGSSHYYDSGSLSVRLVNPTGVYNRFEVVPVVAKIKDMLRRREISMSEGRYEVYSTVSKSNGNDRVWEYRKVITL